ncbi:MAG: permease [Christensenellales bacterium]
MLQATVILSVAAIILILVNARKTGKQFEGLKSGMKQMLQSLPLILCAFILAGMIEVLIPMEFIRNWLSKEAGLKGIFLGTFGGMLLATGPYAAFPIIATIMVSGAGLGTFIALIAGWCLLGLSKAPFETAFYGVKFFTYKLLISVPFCFVVGLLGHIVEIALT